MRLLLVEDDQLLGDGIQTALEGENYAVNWVKDGDAAITTLDIESYDIVILDIGLPKRSGLHVLKHLRAAGNDTPVLILTARDTIDDRVQGLDSGADDYLVKPFDLDELTARLRALLRRHGGRRSPLISHGNIKLDPAAHIVTMNDQIIDLSPREFSVLQALLENQGKVLSRAKLEESLYAWGNEVESNAIEVHIHHIRKKLGNDIIRTVRGVGYIIDHRNE